MKDHQYMKKIQYLAALLLPMLVSGCSEWSDHFDEAGMTASGNVEIYNGDIVSYMKNTQDVSSMSTLFASNGIYDSTFADREYTFIVCNNEVYSAQQQQIADAKQYARYSVANLAVNPNSLTEGYGIHTRSGKSVWVYGSGDEAKLDDYNITKRVKTNNGYVYYVDGVIPVRASVYEYLNTLSGDYADFKTLVQKYEERYFDRAHSTITGVNNAGQTTYDSVWVTRSELMDRYTSAGVEQWNMRSENHETTMFIPTNTQIKTAINNALDSIPVWLNREATDADKEKFEKWIVKACFVSNRLENDEVSAIAPGFESVGGYQKIIDTQNDETDYKSIDPAWWLPSVQRANIDSKVTLSNGCAYKLNNFKIPNHIVIYRVKSRFYELWNAMTDTQKTSYFRWTNWQNPLVINDCQGEFTLSNTLPTMYYHELTAEPTQEAHDSAWHCMVDYDGLVYDDNSGSVQEVNLPAGEYYLRMGFKHSLTYSVSISFNDSLLVKNMCLNAQGSNFHFDRGAASEVPHYGLGGIAYPEGFDPDEWMEKDAKAIAYDTDGYTVGIVKLKKSGNFHITIDSYDNAQLYTYKIGDVGVRTKNNIQQLMMYHWCLRPTINNY